MCCDAGADENSKLRLNMAPLEYGVRRTIAYSILFICLLLFIYFFHFCVCFQKTMCLCNRTPRVRC